MASCFVHPERPPIVDPVYCRAAGLSKAEALRAAQIELIRQPIPITAAQGQTLEMDASSPFYWAAFQLFGDWR